LSAHLATIDRESEDCVTERRRQHRRFTRGKPISDLEGKDVSRRDGGIQNALSLGLRTVLPTVHRQGECGRKEDESLRAFVVWQAFCVRCPAVSTRVNESGAAQLLGRSGTGTPESIGAEAGEGAMRLVSPLRNSLRAAKGTGRQGNESTAHARAIGPSARSALEPPRPGSASAPYGRGLAGDAVKS
jgi:hypothetical protein